jgi:hypothetical protein
MTAAQRAMATAMIYPKADKGGRGRKANEIVGFSSQRLSYARTVVHLPVIAQAVLAGSKSLDEAYNDVQIATGGARGCAQCARHFRSPSLK